MVNYSLYHIENNEFFELRGGPLEKGWGQETKRIAQRKTKEEENRAKWKNRQKYSSNSGKNSSTSRRPENIRKRLTPRQSLF